MRVLSAPCQMRAGDLKAWNAHDPPVMAKFEGGNVHYAVETRFARLGPPSLTGSG